MNDSAPQLDDRLLSVAHFIRSSVHVDIGSDHGQLLAWLLAREQIERAIAVENKRSPFENSRRALEGLAAEVRLGDGLSVVQAGEVDSLSICGMGAKRMVAILERFPQRVPSLVVLQPSRQPEVVREWGLGNDFHLIDERPVSGRWPNMTLVFRTADVGQENDVDPAYDGIDRESALLFGPHVLRRGGQVLEALLVEERDYWSRFVQLESRHVRRLELVRQWLAGER